MITTIITFIIVFGVIVFIHEFGHFYFAKRAGILVREFSIGMGPKLFNYRTKDTTYTIRLLPLGGYVRMAGSEDDEDELKPGTPVNLHIGLNNKVNRINTSKKSTLFNGIPMEVTATDLENELWIEGNENGDDSHIKRYEVDHDATVIEHDGTEVRIAPRDVQFKSASIGHRLMTNFAGPMNNFILAIIVYTILSFIVGGAATNDNRVTPTGSGVTIAQKSGLKSGDAIVAVNGKKVSNWSSLSKAIQIQANKKTKITVKRYGNIKELTMTPKANKIQGKTIGVVGITPYRNNSLKAKLLSGFTQTWNMTLTLLTALWSMVSGHFSLNDLGGPVAIFATTSVATSEGIAGILGFLAFLSLNLGLVNLLPIPALDGGKILLNVIEAIRRKPFSETVETAITLAGVAFLVILMLLVTWNDIDRYFIR